MPEEIVELSENTSLDGPWVCIVWNDPVNLMSYVTFVFKQYFGYSQEKAESLMMAVHQVGKAVVSAGGRDEMERDATAMHSYGLWATVHNDGEGS
jgi:ATP-dependent Clp protease adaptor protein ClpS